MTSEKIERHATKTHNDMDDLERLLAEQQKADIKVNVTAYIAHAGHHYFMIKFTESEKSCKSTPFYRC